jgi:DNA invertase Pin-like site-specific DNA recombinase
MLGDYNRARDDDDRPASERLAKVVQSLSKQIQVHEVHERETIPRNEVIRAFHVLGGWIGRWLKDHDGETLDANQAITDICFDGLQKLDSELGFE